MQERQRPAHAGGFMHTSEIRDLTALEYQNIGVHVLGKKNARLEYPLPRLFLVLPGDLNSWIDPNSKTHRLRLYYVCDHDKGTHDPGSVPQFKHISDHQGHDTRQLQEFFRKYGHYTLVILMMSRLGSFSGNGDEVLPHSTRELLWGHDV